LNHTSLDAEELLEGEYDISEEEDMYDEDDVEFFNIG
jgi:hypothetical protein